MQPKIFYTIFFSQRNGSSLLCEALKSTGVAGNPGELFHISENQSLKQHYNAKNYEELRDKIWQAGSNESGVHGIKVNAPKPQNDSIINELKNISGIQKQNPSNYEVWENIFPNNKYIFLTRRNKVRQAVSWWKAIVSTEWHRKTGEKAIYNDVIRDKYDFDALTHLLKETVFRECKIQDFFKEGNLTPLTIVYEDFINNYESTIKKVIEFIGIEKSNYSIAPPYYEKLADDLSDEWVERFRKESQKNWDIEIW